MATTDEDVLSLFRETDRKFQETEWQLSPLEQRFTSPWEKLMESLVEGDLVELLAARDIPITDTTTRLKGKLADGGKFGFDILAHHGVEVENRGLFGIREWVDATRLIDFQPPTLPEWPFPKGGRWCSTTRCTVWGSISPK